MVAFIVQNQNKILITFVFSVYITNILYLSYVVNNVKNTPYMDEVFHIPQAERYCNNNFTYWDPKITTPPGLYLISTGIIQPFHWFSNNISCDVKTLRFVNVLFACGNFYLFYCLAMALKPQRSTKKHVLLTALALSIFPPLYFFNFFYYTDPGSVFFVLLMYLFHLNSRYGIASIFGALSIFFRQTNIIWVFFVGASRSLEIIQSRIRVEGSKRKTNPRQLIGALINQKKQFPVVIAEILGELGVYLFLAILFLAVVVYNQGLALGDRDAHQLVLNVPQLGYFFAFTLFFSNSLLITLPLVNKFLSFLIHAPFIVGSLACGWAIAIKHLSLVHPYLLADNRHYVFYIWRKIIARNAASPFFLIPVYIYGSWAINQRLAHRTLLFRVLLATCLILATAPQKLLEFRYFVIPYIMFRLHGPAYMTTQLVTEICLYIAINAYTVYMFVNKPFSWPDVDTLQHFMW